MPLDDGTLTSNIMGVCNGKCNPLYHKLSSKDEEPDRNGKLKKKVSTRSMNVSTIFLTSGIYSEDPLALPLDVIEDMEREETERLSSLANLDGHFITPQSTYSRLTIVEAYLFTMDREFGLTHEYGHAGIPERIQEVVASYSD